MESILSKISPLEDFCKSWDHPQDNYFILDDYDNIPYQYYDEKEMNEDMEARNFIWQNSISEQQDLTIWQNLGPTSKLSRMVSIQCDYSDTSDIGINKNKFDVFEVPDNLDSNELSTTATQFQARPMSNFIEEYPTRFQPQLVKETELGVVGEETGQVLEQQFEEDQSEETAPNTPMAITGQKQKKVGRPKKQVQEHDRAKADHDSEILDFLKIFNRGLPNSKGFIQAIFRQFKTIILKKKYPFAEAHQTKVKKALGAKLYRQLISEMSAARCLYKGSLTSAEQLEAIQNVTLFQTSLYKFNKQAFLQMLHLPHYRKALLVTLPVIKKCGTYENSVGRRKLGKTKAVDITQEIFQRKVSELLDMVLYANQVLK
ncbi:hypothetical protein FGO68_gene733 [Halteria grandinella]|uniref:Uncharacterized protein n=1 Tax=Halteria grandinella TaxID=5974 RepID=A0A8J8NMQ6_HALGN|nr:hypothetical protein FGO68_gene733 [Halteria grandinella]